MILKAHSFQNLRDNVLFDDVLFQLAQKHTGEEYLRFWESPTYGVVLGRTGSEIEDVDPVTTANDGVPVIRRTSGGGTVLQGPGCLNYCLILSKQKRPELNDLRQSYQLISQQIIDVLARQGVKAMFSPISDLALSANQKKFSGNAQRRGKDIIMHHGTILYDFNLELISKYLKMPKDMPEYRKARQHKDFVANICIKTTIFQQDLCDAFGALYLTQPITALENSLLEKINI